MKLDFFDDFNMPADYTVNLAIKSLVSDYSNHSTIACTFILYTPQYEQILFYFTSIQSMSNQQLHIDKGCVMVKMSV